MSTNTDCTTTSSPKKQVAKEVTAVSWHGQPLRTAPGWAIMKTAHRGGRGDRSLGLGPLVISGVAGSS